MSEILFCLKLDTDLHFRGDLRLDVLIFEVKTSCSLQRLEYTDCDLSLGKKGEPIFRLYFCLTSPQINELGPSLMYVRSNATFSLDS